MSHVCYISDIALHGVSSSVFLCCNQQKPIRERTDVVFEIQMLFSMVWPEVCFVILFDFSRGLGT